MVIKLYGWMFTYFLLSLLIYSPQSSCISLVLHIPHRKYWAGWFSNSVFFLFFFSCYETCSILVPWPGIKLAFLALEACSLNHCNPRDVPSNPSWIQESNEWYRWMLSLRRGLSGGSGNSWLNQILGIVKKWILYSLRLSNWILADKLT